MNARDRDLSRLLSAIAAEANSKLLLIQRTGSGHLKARFDRGGPVFISGMPSDYRDRQT
jgi:hypothetical protein